MGTQRQLSDEYQHDRVLMAFKDLCVLVRRTKVASALEGFRHNTIGHLLIIFSYPPLCLFYITMRSNLMKAVFIMIEDHNIITMGKIFSITYHNDIKCTIFHFLLW